MMKIDMSSRIHTQEKIKKQKGYTTYNAQCVAVCCSVLQCVAVPRHPHLTKGDTTYNAQCVAVCCSVLQCVAVPRHPHLTKRRHSIQRTATHCNMNESCHTDTQEDLKGNKVICYHCGLAFCKEVTNYQVLQSVAVCCSLLQSVAVCCTLLQYS